MQPHHSTPSRTTPAFAAPCVLFGAKHAGFAPVVSPLRLRNATVARPRRCSRVHFTAAAEPLPPNRFEIPLAAYRFARKVVSVSVLSLTVLMSGIRGVNANSVGGQVQIPRDSASDVEAAAVTLGAVTVGGLVMRAILTSRRDEDKEREKLAAECARLEQEELLRARRLERKAMERVEGDEELPEDDALRNSLSKRLKDMENADDSSDDNAVPGILLDKPEDKNKFMRNNPIPERGTGSMLLDRPDGNESGGTEGGNGNEEALEKLRRMWNLDANDKEDRTSR